MPRLTNPLSVIVITCIIIGCSKPAPVDERSIEGSWNLTKYLDVQTNSWKNYGDSIIYQKHLTPDFFVWFKFDKKNEVLLGLGGGTYKIENGKYIENIAFFYPPLPTLVGESIPFEMKFENDQWMHKGFFLRENTDAETAIVTNIDTVKIDEIWTKSTKSVPESMELINTWKMISFRQNLNDLYIEYPDFIRFIKLITPTHFVWVKYENNGDEVYASGAGTYTFDGDHYTETINMISPSNTGQIGETIDFSFQMNKNKWHHFGYVPELIIDSAGIRKDSILIDEFWSPL